MDHSSLIFTAIQAALRAGELLRKGFGTSFSILTKPGMQNLVTEYDKAAEKCIIDTISDAFPDHAFLAEESGESGVEDSKVLWVIDPLDGTVNFAHNIPIFSVSIAAAVRKEVVCGVIYQPMLGELFTAEKGRGAYLNGAKLQVSPNHDPKKSMMGTGFPYNVNENPHHCLNHFLQIAQMGIPIRRLGSAAIDLAYVAAGRFDAYWEVELHPWDVAAGKLLIEEAGGKVTHYDGSPRPLINHKNLLSSNGRFHEEMVSILSNPHPKK